MTDDHSTPLRDDMLTMAPFVPALRAMFTCLALALGRISVEAARNAVADPLDWSAVVDWGIRHEVPGLLEQAVLALGPDVVPAAATARLTAINRRRREALLQQFAEIRRIHQIFATAGIDCLVLKGVALSQTLFGDPATRRATDIDLLVDPDRLDAAETVLRDAGYRRTSPAYDLSPVRRAAYLRLKHHFCFIWPQSRQLIELHWRPIPEPGLWDVPFRDLYARSVAQTVGGTAIRTLGHRDLLSHLIVHGGKQGWWSAKPLADVAALLSRMPAADIAAVRQSHRRTGTGAMVDTALDLAEGLLSVPTDLPLGGSIRTRADRAVRRQTADAVRLLACETVIDRDRPVLTARLTLLPLLRLRRSWRYRLRILWRMAHRPADWSQCALPDRLFFLYVPLRPVLFIDRAVRRVVGRRR